MTRTFLQDVMMDRHVLLASLMLLLSSTSMAQNDSHDSGKTVIGKQTLSVDTVARQGVNVEMTGSEPALQPMARESYFACGQASEDSLHLPPLAYMGTGPLMSGPYNTWWGLDTWQLHKGLNMNIGASVFASFGKGAPKGAGFSQNVSLMYAMPLSKRVSLAVGGWVSNAYWAHDRYTDAGLSAMLGYKFDEHWEAYVYGRKSLMDKPVPYNFYTMRELGDRIGAAVKYNFSPNFSIQVSVEAGDYKSPCHTPEPPGRMYKSRNNVP